MPETTENRIDELVEIFRELVRAVEPRTGPTTVVGGEQQTVLFAYQWINGHLGRSDVVPPVLHVDRRKGILKLQSAPPSGATQALVFAEDGTVEAITLTEDRPQDLPLELRDNIPIAFVEFRTEHGAPVAIIHRIPGL